MANSNEQGIFEDVSFDDIIERPVLTDEGFAYKTDFSDFPQAIDALKEIEYQGTGFAEIADDLQQYYYLLIKYLNNPGSMSTNDYDKFVALTHKLANYSLNNSDYILLRDALLECGNYLITVVDNLIGPENGVYSKLQESAADYQTRLNEIITQVNENYQNFVSGDELGGVFPPGSITEKYLDEDLLNMFNYLMVSGGVYIDYTKNPDVTLPEGISVAPSVIKVLSQEERA